MSNKVEEPRADAPIVNDALTRLHKEVLVRRSQFAATLATVYGAQTVPVLKQLVKEGRIVEWQFGVTVGGVEKTAVFLSLPHTMMHLVHRK